MNKILSFISISSLLIVLASCSGFGKNIDISSDIHKLSRAAGLNGLTLTTIPDLDRIYLIDGLDFDAELYFNSHIECRAKGLSTQEYVTGIFQGFRTPEIKSENRLKLSGKDVILTRVQTAYQDTDLFLTIYTRKSPNCLADYLFWSPANIANLTNEDLLKLNNFVAALIE